MTVGGPVADLADIDAFEKRAGLKSRMDTAVEQLDYDELDVLGLACGFGPEKKRQWGAIARWVNSLGYDHDTIKADHVSHWARSG